MEWSALQQQFSLEWSAQCSVEWSGVQQWSAVKCGVGAEQYTGLECSAQCWSGVEWSAVECSEVWSALQCPMLEWSGVECSGVQ